MLLEKQKGYPLKWISIGVSITLHILLLFISFPKPAVDLDVVMSSQHISIPISLDVSTSPLEPIPGQRAIPKSPPPSKELAKHVASAPDTTPTAKPAKTLASRPSVPAGPATVAPAPGSASGVGSDLESVPGDRKAAHLSAPISPTYPKDALARGLSGVVRLWVHINEEGQVVAWKVEKSSGHDVLDQSFIRAVRSCRWEPKRVMGKNVPDSQFLTHVYQI